MTAAANLQVGDSLEGCEIIAPLRAGGMASLFLGRRTGAEGFARKVAVKVVHPHLATDPGFTAMFIDEAKLCSRINHPNVVHVESFGRHGDKYYLIMEFVDGCSLRQLLFDLRERELRLSPPMAVNMIMGVLDGLHAAHEATDAKGRPLNIVHRDVSPSNILLDYQGPVKLIDFGVAKAEGRSQETDAGHIKGKFNYMAPEQARAEDVDRRVDVYAAALILWEMLTQRRYNDGATPMESLTTAITPSGVAARDLLPSLDRKLNKVLMRALSTDPRRRPASARDFRRQLAEVCPKALSIDDQDRSDFVVTVMRAYMRLQAAKLPEDITGIFGRNSLTGSMSASAAEDRLSTHTALLGDVRRAENSAQLEGTTRTVTTAASSRLRVMNDVTSEVNSIRLWLGILFALVLGAGMIWFALAESRATPPPPPVAGEVVEPTPAPFAPPTPPALPAQPSAAVEPSGSAEPSLPSAADTSPLPSASETPRADRPPRRSPQGRVAGMASSPGSEELAGSDRETGMNPPTGGNSSTEDRPPTGGATMRPPSQRLREVGGTRLLSTPGF